MNKRIVILLLSSTTAFLYSQCILFPRTCHTLRPTEPLEQACDHINREAIPNQLILLPPSDRVREAELFGEAMEIRNLARVEISHSEMPERSQRIYRTLLRGEGGKGSGGRGGLVTPSSGVHQIDSASH